MEEELGESLERSQTFVVQMSFDATCAAFTDMLDTSQVYLRPVQWNNLADGLKVVEFQVDVVDLGAVDDYEEVDEDCYDLTLRDVEIRLRTMDNQSTRVEVKGWEGSTLIVPEGAVHQPPLVARALWFDNFMDHFYEDLSQAGIPVDWPLPPIMKLQGMTVLQARLVSVRKPV